MRCLSIGVDFIEIELRDRAILEKWLSTLWAISWDDSPTLAARRLGFLLSQAPSGFSLTQVSSSENNAKANPLTSGFEVLTDFNNTYQEYVVLTPEPSTFLMVGTVLIGLFLFS